jgi:hypothetical protein
MIKESFQPTFFESESSARFNAYQVDFVQLPQDILCFVEAAPERISGKVSGCGHADAGVGRIPLRHPMVSLCAIFVEHNLVSSRHSYARIDSPKPLASPRPQSRKPALRWRSVCRISYLRRDRFRDDGLDARTTVTRPTC